MIELLGAAAVMGLVGSPHCMGMCGPFALACSGRSTHLVAWQSGKLATYVTLGAITGALGVAAPGPVWLPQLFSAGLILWFAAAMAGVVPEPRLPVPGLTRLAVGAARSDGLLARGLFGAANGLLPCGLVYAALGLAVVSGGWLTGALVMAAFGLATAPLLSAFGLSGQRLLVHRPRARRALALVISLAGLWVVVRRGGMPPPS